MQANAPCAKALVASLSASLTPQLQFQIQDQAVKVNEMKARRPGLRVQLQLRVLLQRHGVRRRRNNTAEWRAALAETRMALHNVTQANAPCAKALVASIGARTRKLKFQIGYQAIKMNETMMRIPSLRVQVQLGVRCRQNNTAQ